MAKAKLGFHTGPGGMKDGLGAWMRALNSAGIPFGLKAADEYGPLFEAVNVGRQHNVANWLGFRFSRAADRISREVPDYNVAPWEDAPLLCHELLDKLPPEFDQSVWLEPINEPRDENSGEDTMFNDMNAADYLGEWCLAAAKFLNERGYKFMGPAFNAGRPGREGFPLEDAVAQYSQPGMLKFLRYCADNPEMAGLSVHDYSWSTWQEGQNVADWYPNLWGRFEAAIAAADLNGIPRAFPIFVTEFGFAHTAAPRWPEALVYLDARNRMLARWPQVKYDAAWTLQQGWRAVDQHVNSWLNYDFQQEFDEGEQPARTHGAFGSTLPGDSHTIRSLPPERIGRPVTPETAPPPPAVPATATALLPAIKFKRVSGAEMLNLRAGPSVNHAIIQELKKGTAVEVLVEGLWDQIRVGGVTGFVNSKFLAEDEPAPPPRPQPAPPPELTAAIPAEWRPVIWAITSIFESGVAGGRADAYQNQDAGIVSYGKHQATLQSGNLERVLNIYFQRSQSAASQALRQEYAARVQRKEESLRHDARFKQLLLDAAREPEMSAAQDELFEANFYRPVAARARELGLRTPLGLACLYDTRIQGGLDGLLTTISTQLGVTAVGQAGPDGRAVDEPTWIRAFLAEREAWLNRLADQRAREGRHTDAQFLRTSTFRVTELRRLLDAGNLELAGAFTVRGQRINGPEQQRQDIPPDLPASPPMKRVNAEAGLNVRSAPSTAAEVIHKLADGAAVELLEEGAQWDHIRVDDITGYVFNQFLVAAEGWPAPGDEPARAPDRYVGPKVDFVAGIHGPGDAHTWHDPNFRNMLVKLGMPVKFMSDGDRFRWYGEFHKPALELVRVFWSPDPSRRKTAQQAWEGDICDGVMNFYNSGARHFEVHNEPRLPKEGMGSQWKDGDQFGDFLRDLMLIIKKHCPEARLWYPGESPGVPWTDQFAFSRPAYKKVADLCYGVCQHAYSGNTKNVDAAVHDIVDQVRQFHGALGVWDKPIIVSECSVNRAVTPEFRAKVYTKVAQELRRIPGVKGVFWYVSHWNAPEDEIANAESWYGTNLPELYQGLNS
jgi:uncharacterized protein YgiM (DUF1202 family)